MTIIVKVAISCCCGSPFLKQINQPFGWNVLCWVNFCSHWQFLCSGFGAGSRSFPRPVPCLSTREVLGDFFLDVISHKLCPGGMVSNYRWFRGFLLVGDELRMWDPCSSKDLCTHPWTPRCHQSEIIYNSTSWCPPPPTSITVCIIMNSLILPFFIKSVVSETNVLHLQLLNLPCLGQPLE